MKLYSISSVDMCVYKGQMYQQGQKWQDGCDYVCECVDSVAGRYMCTERSAME